MNPMDEEPSYGLDAMRADFERWASAFDEFRVTVEEIIDAGDQVVLVAHHQGRGRKSRGQGRDSLLEVYTVREGKCLACG
jgi:ketosteroid isomerase-like protein